MKINVYYGGSIDKEDLYVQPTILTNIKAN